MKHTKGKWEVSKYENGSIAIGIAAPKEYKRDLIKTVATLHKIEINQDELDANAKLIAAAPELLKLLLDVESVVAKEYNIMKGSNLHCVIKSIIKKATQ